jgi:hypothetical protein
LLCIYINGMQVNGLAGPRGSVEEGQQTAAEVRAKDVAQEAAERVSGVVGGEHALEAPETVVAEEHVAAKEVSEGDSKVGTLDVVGEFGAQEVVDDPWAADGDTAYEASVPRTSMVEAGDTTRRSVTQSRKRCRLRRKGAVLPSPQFGFRQWFALPAATPSELGAL